VKTLSHDDRVVTKKHLPFRVCMHVRGVVRTDGRVMRAATALVEAGFAVTILDIEDDLTRPVEEDIGGIHVKHIMKSGWLKPVRFGPFRLIRSTQKLVYITLQLIRIPADVYHAHDDNALAPCYIAAQWHHKPLIFDAHEFPLIEMKEQHWWSALLTRLFTHMVKRCAGIITVSSPIAQEICNLYHVPHVSLIRNLPVYQAPSKSDRLRQYLSLDSNARIALYQGNMDSKRGLDKLVRAAKYLDRNIVIVLMGNGFGATPALLKSLIVSEGVVDRVKIIPAVPYAELLDWTASADIGLNVLPPDYSLSIRLCLPNKFFEYLMAGLPVLSSPLPAVAEIINTYDVGQIVSSLAPADVGNAINAMLADWAALARWSRNAREAARYDLCWEKEGRHLIRLYLKILAARDEVISGLHWQ